MLLNKKQVEDIKRKDADMNDGQQNKHPQEEEIDLLELALKVWAERRWILKCCGYAVIVGLVIAFSIPKEYTATATIAPELSDGKSGGGLSSLAAMAGINMNASSSADAIYPDLYPDIVSSTPFITELFDVHVESLNAKIDTTLYGYIDDYQRSPWWSAVTSAPFKVLGWIISIFKDKEEPRDNAKLDPFHLTNEEADVVRALSQRISVFVDKKTGLTTLSVTMQDARIAACLTDTVMSQLQNYVTEYRTNKARKYFQFQQSLFERKKKEYEKAQEEYAKFADANKNIILLSYRVEQERLENDMRLAYNVYTSVAQQLQVAEAKVQEITPVYTIVEPATIPIRAAKPNKAMVLIGIVLLVGVGCVGWILFGKKIFRDLKK
ncbi:chain length determinant protein [Bacteroides uniformis]|jgi:Chain length determinant protein|nr:chain length determinant protein [Bacteroides uniformis]